MKGNGEDPKNADGFEGMDRNSAVSKNAGIFNAAHSRAFIPSWKNKF